MNKLSGKIRTALVRLQQDRVNFYLKAAERFTSNPLIHDKWLSIAGGLDAQGGILKNLSPSFWKFLDEGEAASILEAARQAIGEKGVADSGQVTLREYFTRALELEEPTVTRVYAPIVRDLRVNWTARAMDLYVMVRSHLTQLTRLIEPFCGDPSLCRRCASLADRFEQEIQRPKVVEREMPGSKKARSGKPAKQARAAARTRRPAKPARASGARGSRPQRLVKHAKPLVRKMKIARSGARG
jgi:hypothetical protein